MAFMESATSESDERPPWHRQPEDTRSSFHAFMHYRDLPPWSRSIDAAYREHQEKCKGAEQKGRQKGGKKSAEDEPSRAPRRWQTWSSENNWVARVREYDTYRAEVRSQRRAAELDQALDDQATIADAGLRRIAVRLNSLRAEDIPARMLPQLLRAVSEVQLRALGHANKVAVEHSGQVNVRTLADVAREVAREDQ